MPKNYKIPYKGTYMNKQHANGKVPNQGMQNDNQISLYTMRITTIKKSDNTTQRRM